MAIAWCRVALQRSCGCIRWCEAMWIGPAPHGLLGMIAIYEALRLLNDLEFYYSRDPSSWMGRGFHHRFASVSLPA